jgi:chromosome segregation ATPase
VDRSFFYRPQHRDLLAQVQAAAAEPRTSTGTGTGPAVSRASLQADLANSENRAKRLADRVALLEKRLSEVLGEQVWQQSGLGTPDDVEDLKRKIINLEESNADLRLKLEEATDELDAARGTNRELMAQLNTSRGKSAR